MPELNRVTQSFVLDFRRPAVNRLKVVNGDTANTFVITLKDGGKAVSLNMDLHKVIAVFKRADGQVYTQDASTGCTFTATGVVTIDVRPASFRSGTNTVELQVYKRESNAATTYPLLATTYPQAFTARNETLTGEGENSPSQLPMLEQIIHDAGEATTAANNAADAANLAAAAANAAAALYPGIYMLPYETSEWIDGTDGAAYDYQTELSITTEEYLALLENKPDVVLGVRVTLPSGKEVTLIEYNRHGAPNTTDVDFKADDVVDGYFVTATLVENWDVDLVIKLWTAEHYVGYNDLIEEMVSASRNLNNLPVGRYTSEQAPAHAPTAVTGADANKYFGVSGYIEVSPSTKYTARFYNITPRNARHCVSYYNASKQYIGNFSNLDIGAQSNQVTFTTPATAKYVHIYKYDADGITISADSHLLLEKFISSTDYGYVGPRTLIDDTARVAAAEARKGVNALGTRVTALEGDGPIVLHVASVTESNGRKFITFEDGEADIIYANAFTRDMEFEMPAQNTAQTVTNASIRMRKISAKTDTNNDTLVEFSACSFGSAPNITYAVAGVYFTGDTFYVATYDEGEVTVS